MEPPIHQPDDWPREHTSGPLVELEVSGAALIVDWPTGVWYVHQAAGVACASPSTEGLLVPIPEAHETPVGSGGLVLLGGVLSDLSHAHHLCGGQGISEHLADEFDAHLSRFSTFLRARIDRERLGLSMEAWAYVQLDYVESATGLGLPRHAVLVWENCD